MVAIIDGIRVWSTARSLPAEKAPCFSSSNASSRGTYIRCGFSTLLSAVMSTTQGNAQISHIVSMMRKADILNLSNLVQPICSNCLIAHLRCHNLPWSDGWQNSEKSSSDKSYGKWRSNNSRNRTKLCKLVSLFSGIYISTHICLQESMWLWAQLQTRNWSRKGLQKTNGEKWGEILFLYFTVDFVIDSMESIKIQFASEWKTESIEPKREQ